MLSPRLFLVLNLPPQILLYFGQPLVAIGCQLLPPVVDCLYLLLKLGNLVVDEMDLLLGEGFGVDKFFLKVGDFLFEGLTSELLLPVEPMVDLLPPLVEQSHLRGSRADFVAIHLNYTPIKNKHPMQEQVSTIIGPLPLSPPVTNCPGLDPVSLSGPPSTRGTPSKCHKAGTPASGCSRSKQPPSVKPSPPRTVFTSAATQIWAQVPQ